MLLLVAVASLAMAVMAHRSVEARQLLWAQILSSTRMYACHSMHLVLPLASKTATAGVCPEHEPPRMNYSAIPTVWF